MFVINLLNITWLIEELRFSPIRNTIGAISKKYDFNLYSSEIRRK